MKNLIKKILKEEQDLGWAQDVVNSELRPTRSLTVKRQTNNPKNAIELHTETMHGDGDSYDKNKVIFYAEGKGTWNNDDYNAKPNFEDFERVVEFLKNGNLSQLGDDDELSDYYNDLGCIDYSEYADYGYEMATVEEVYFYDINGNKYDATIDGLSSTADYVDEDDELEEDDEDLDGDEMDEEEEDEECQVCGGDDDTGEGICSDCQLDRADEDASYTQ